MSIARLVGADIIRPLVYRGFPGGAGLPGRGAAFDVKSGGKTTRACGPWTQGAHGGGELYGQGKNRAGIAARFLGGFVTGAAAPRVARIRITLQAPGAAALYRLGPPGRRRCLASEKLWWLW